MPFSRTILATATAALLSACSGSPDPVRPTARFEGVMLPGGRADAHAAGFSFSCFDRSCYAEQPMSIGGIEAVYASIRFEDRRDWWSLKNETRTIDWRRPNSYGYREITYHFGPYLTAEQTCDYAVEGAPCPDPTSGMGRVLSALLAAGWNAEADPDGWSAYKAGVPVAVRGDRASELVTVYLREPPFQHLRSLGD